MTNAVVGSSYHSCQKVHLCLMACDERVSIEKEFMVMKDIKVAFKEHVVHLNLSPEYGTLLIPIL